SGAITPWSAQITWQTTPRAVTAQISIDSPIVDTIPGANAGATLEELWPKPSYSVSVRIVDAAGQQLAQYAASVRTAVQSSPFPRLYSDSSFLNTPIASSPTLA